MLSQRNPSSETDQQAMQQARAVLRVTEFRVFELAFYDWYGNKAAETLLDAAYMDYLIHDRVPHWVRHYVRATLRLCDEAGCYVPKMVTRPMAVTLPMAAVDGMILLGTTLLVTLLMGLF